MPTQRFTHSLKELCHQLDAKIKQLEHMRDQVQNKLNNNIGVTTNAEALKQITSSLAHAVDARRAMQESCCNQGCEIDWQDQ